MSHALRTVPIVSVDDANTAPVKDAKDHSRVTPAGRVVGFQTARLVEPAVAALARQGEPDERCKSCAGTYGTVPNGCLQTQMDFTKAVIENVPFLCRQADRKRMPCHAWFAARVHILKRCGPVERSVPWEFSPPDEPEAT